MDLEYDEELSIDLVTEQGNYFFFLLYIEKLDKKINEIYFIFQLTILTNNLQFLALITLIL
jgi:hypothetical protein